VVPWSLIVALGASFLSMPFFALKGARRDRDADQKGSRFLVGFGDFFLHWFLWVLRPVERALLRVGATPDQLNLAGLVFGVLSGVFVSQGYLEVGGWSMVGSGIADILDGRVARARGTTSAYGRFIDSTLDRFAEFFVLMGFVVFLRDRPWGVVFAAAALGGSLLVSYAQARGEGVGAKRSGGLMQRAERVVLLCLACLSDSAVSAWMGEPRGQVVIGVLGFVALTSLGTAVYRTFLISRRLLKG
jgi:CDP-diacylglycerol--glycerol-3-phosphate 3-phosphatidyltransferase